MSAREHDRDLLAGHALDALDPEERAAVEEHLAGCPQCRRELAELKEAAMVLHELPPEALLEGPPDDGDVVLQRTLRQVRDESRTGVLRRRLAAGVAAAVLLVAGVAGGAALFDDQRSPQLAGPPAPTEPTASPLPEGTRVGSSTDPRTGARMTVRVVPAAGWVRVNAAVSGIAEGERCRLWVVASDGSRRLAGSWVVSAKGATEGTALDGSALVAPDDVAAVEVDNVSGRRYVSVPL